MKKLQVLVVGSIAIMATFVEASVVSPEEMGQKDEWVSRNLLSAGNTPPFSFSYGGQSSSNLLAAWGRSVVTNVLDTNRTEYVLLWTNAAAGLEVRCRAVDYRDFPAVEWTVCLKNIGSGNTPIIDNLLGLDVGIQRSTGGEFVLRYWNGDSYEMGGDSYHPFETALGPNASANFAPTGGRGTNRQFPYYNLAMPGGGMLIAVGWPGQWKTAFARDGGTNLVITAGQELTHLYLAPGETIRAPLMALLFWNGADVVRAQNLWRRWYMAHVMPRANGKTPDAMAQIQVEHQLYGYEYEMDQILSACTNAGIKVDLCWLDAGWYPCNGNWPNTGTWEIDASRYPNGFKPFTDSIHTQGMKFVLWNEPERVGWSSSWLAQNHPGWLLGGTLLNLGNSNALAWAKDHFDSLIKSNGVDVYRQDFNMDPLSNWRNNDASDRQGMTENLHVQGYLAYWDSLLAGNPGLLIDSCASGGRRNDLESMRRAVPLWRSDYVGTSFSNEFEANQGFTYGISSWLPYYGSWGSSREKYRLRSVYTTCFGFGTASGDVDGSVVNAYAECRKITPCMLGDYYPLTTYAGANDLTAWIAWQFDRPEAGDGVVQAFRRPSSTLGSMLFKLQGLQETNVYAVEDFDAGGSVWRTGRELMEDGLRVNLNPRQAAVIYYHPATGVTVTASAAHVVAKPPLFVQFSATGFSASGRPLAYHWTFGDSGTSVEQNPTHTYAAAGRYVAEVTADDGNGNTAKAAVPVAVLGARQKMKIDFSGYDKPETLTNFPALVVFGPHLATNGFAYGQVASSNGWDLSFANSNETQELNYEIESWDTNGNSYVWVQVPQLAMGGFIWAYFGDSNAMSAPAACASNGATWDRNHQGVWHMADGASLSLKDSTANGYNGAINSGTPSADSGGKAGGAVSLNSGDLAVADISALNNAPQFSVSLWCRITSYGPSGAAFFSKLHAAGEWGYDILLAMETSNNLFFQVDNGADGSGYFNVAPGGWAHLYAVFDGRQTGNANRMKIYYNGTEQSLSFGSYTVPDLTYAFPSGANETIGSYAGGWKFQGSIDEGRVENVARSSNWVWACWLNMASNGVFNGYGAVTGVGGGVDAYGIPDSWKMLYFGGTNGAGTGALEDRDHDGMSNYAEWKAGTCPTNASSRFQVSGFRCQGGTDFVIQWSSVADRFYTIQESTNLFNGFPATVASNIQATPAMNTATVIIDQAESGFYRVKVE